MFRRPQVIRTGAVLAAVLTVTLAGCATQDVVATAPDEPTPSVSPTTAPETPDATGDLDPADPDSWLITFDGIGPLTVGTSIAESAAQLTAYTDTTDTSVCPVSFFEPADLVASPAIWAQPEQGSDVASAVLLTSNARPADMTTWLPHTEEGITVGSTRQEVLDAYPGIGTVAAPYEGWVHYSWPGDGVTSIRFELDSTGELVETIAVDVSPVAPAEYCG